MLLQTQSLSFLPKPSSPPFLSPISPPPPPLLQRGATVVSLPTLSAHNQWLSQVAVDLTSDTGPVELPSSVSSIFATSDDPTVLQTATSVLLTGAISVFLFRSLRRRAKRAKELKFRSSGANKSLKDEALESLKAMRPTLKETKSEPSPVQALLGALTAGVIALILYKFTITIESALNRQAVSDNFSVRQITITIRTIINGLCYLATFVFGINSVGLLLYSGQLAINSFTGDSTGNGSERNREPEAGVANASSEGLVDSTGIKTEDDNQNTGGRKL